MTSAEEIARGLTKAQRCSIMEAVDLRSNYGGYPFLAASVTADPWPQGVAEFLTLHRDRLTPLGLEVRKLLEKKSCSTNC